MEKPQKLSTCLYCGMEIGESETYIIQKEAERTGELCWDCFAETREQIAEFLASSRPL